MKINDFIAVTPLQRLWCTFGSFDGTLYIVLILHIYSSFLSYTPFCSFNHMQLSALHKLLPKVPTLFILFSLEFISCACLILHTFNLRLFSIILIFLHPKPLIFKVTAVKEMHIHIKSLTIYVNLPITCHTFSLLFCFNFEVIQLLDH